MIVYTKKYLFFHSTLLAFLVLLNPLTTLAGTITPTETQESLQQHREYDTHTVSHETEGVLSLGYQWLDLDEFERAGEYQYPHSSLTLGLDVSSYPLPHRYHLTTEILGKNNMYGDIGYAYGDLLLFRDIFVDVYHNLDHYNYQHAGSPPTITYLDRNDGDKNYADTLDNFFTLRLKTPNFPFHTFIKHRYIDKKGNIQQRFLLGNFDKINKVSQSRRIDWQSNALTVGTNSHLGPIELEYSYDYSKFNPGSNASLYDFYPLSFMAARPADTYPHNIIPETESFANSIKVHSSYTGGIVASATVNYLKQRNNYSGAASNTWKGAVDLKYVPSPRLNFSLRYRHKSLDNDTPDSVTLTGLTKATTYTVRQAISSQKDFLSLSVKYRLNPKLTLLSSYEFDQLKRKNLDAWVLLTNKAKSNSLKVTLDSRALRNLTFKTSYIYRYVNSPSYNSDPDYSHQLQLMTTYSPTTWLTAFLNYDLNLAARDTTRYLNASPRTLIDAGEQQSRNDRFFGSLSFLFSQTTTLTASWAYYRGEIEQNLIYAKFNDLPFSDSNVPYTDEANSYSLTLQCIPAKDLSFLFNLSHTISKGDFWPGTTVAETPVAISSFSSLKVSETLFSLKIAKKITENWQIGLQFLSNVYNDQNDDQQDGKLYKSTFSLQRHF